MDSQGNVLTLFFSQTLYERLIWTSIND